MSDELFDQIKALVVASPQSSQALLMFGLIKTLDIEKGGHMYLLVKLKEMSAETRQLAYQLMEHMACGRTAGEDWQEFVSTIEAAIRNG